MVKFRYQGNLRVQLQLQSTRPAKTKATKWWQNPWLRSLGPKVSRPGIYKFASRDVKHASDDRLQVHLFSLFLSCVTVALTL